MGTLQVPGILYCLLWDTWDSIYVTIDAASWLYFFLPFLTGRVFAFIRKARGIS